MAKQTLTPEQKEAVKIETAVKKLMNGKSFILLVDDGTNLQTVVQAHDKLKAIGMIELAKNAILNPDRES